MLHILCESKTGRIVLESTEAIAEIPGHFVIQTNAELGVGATHYVEGRDLVELPANNTLSNKFDFMSKTWKDSRTFESQLSLIRIERNKLLLHSDWTQLPDVPLETKELWASYRQALRDITQQPDPFNITWPEPPSN